MSWVTFDNEEYFNLDCYHNIYIKYDHNERIAFIVGMSHVRDHDGDFIIDEFTIGLEKEEARKIMKEVMDKLACNYS